jgi:hypothetical protein
LQDKRSSGAAEGRVHGGGLAADEERHGRATGAAGQDLLDETAVVVGFPGDVVIYRANLMFVDMEEVDLYRLQSKGQRPADVEYAWPASARRAPC